MKKQLILCTLLLPVLCPGQTVVNPGQTVVPLPPGTVYVVAPAAAGGAGSANTGPAAVQQTIVQPVVQPVVVQPVVVQPVVQPVYYAPVSYCSTGIYWGGGCWIGVWDGVYRGGGWRHPPPPHHYNPYLGGGHWGGLRPGPGSHPCGSGHRGGGHR